jgi:hypothetical protein
VKEAGLPEELSVFCLSAPVKGIFLPLASIKAKTVIPSLMSFSTEQLTDSAPF